jgi:hypothetical protein
MSHAYTRGGISSMSLDLLTQELSQHLLKHPLDFRRTKLLGDF